MDISMDLNNAFGCPRPPCCKCLNPDSLVWLATVPAPILNLQGVRVEGVDRTAGDLPIFGRPSKKANINVKCMHYHRRILRRAKKWSTNCCILFFICIFIYFLSFFIYFSYRCHLQTISSREETDRALIEAPSTISLEETSASRREFRLFQHHEQSHFMFSTTKISKLMWG